MPEDNSEHEINHSPKQATLMNTNTFDAQYSLPIGAIPTVAEIFAEARSYEYKEYLSGILDELEDHRVSEESQQRNYAINKQAIKDYEEALRLGNKETSERHLLMHPEARSLGFKFETRVYIKKNTPTNYSLVFTHMLALILDRREDNRTQKALLEDVKKSTNFSDLNANIWKLPLKKYMKRKLTDTLNAHRLPISLASCTCMSDVRKAIDTFYAKKSTIQKTKASIEFTPNEVIVNSNSYKISTVKSGTKEYQKIRLKVNDKRTWLRVDDLKALFNIAA